LSPTHGMMGPLIIAEFVTCGVCLAIGLLHLTIFIFRSDQKADLFFAIMAICAALSAFFITWVYRADTLSDYIFAHKIAITFECIMWIALIWFIALYTGTARRWLAVTVTSAYILAVIINLISPYGVLYAEIEALESVTLAWGERIAFVSGPPNNWRIIADVAWILLIFLAGESCVRLHRRGQRRRSVFFGASLFVFLGFSYLHGTLIDLGVVGPPSLFSFTFLGLILVMSASLTTEVVRASVLSREVAANERRWRSLLEDIRLFVVGVDKAGGINYVNPYFIEVSGFSADDIAGQPFYDIAPQRDRKHLLRLFQDSLKGTVQPHLQATLLKKDGTERQIVWFNVLLRDPDGVISGALSIGDDITERLEAEATRDEAIKELEALKTRLEDENIYLKEQIREVRFFSQIIGKSNALMNPRIPPATDTAREKPLVPEPMPMTSE